MTERAVHDRRLPLEHASDMSRAERLAEITTLVRSRDDKHQKVVTVLAESDVAPHALTDAWLELELAQGDLDDAIRKAIKERL